MRLWDRLCILLGGKDLVILGAEATGKTSMHEFLRDGRRPDGHTYEPTIGRERKRENRPRLRSADGEEVTLAIKKGMDVAGDRMYREDWRRLARDSEVLLYLFDASRVLAGDDEHLSRIEADCQVISDGVGASTLRRVALVGTKTDLIPAESLPARGLVGLQDAFDREPKIHRARMTLARNHLRPPDLVVGSLVREPESFASRIVEHLST